MVETGFLRNTLTIQSGGVFNHYTQKLFIPYE